MSNPNIQLAELIDEFGHYISYPQASGITSTSVRTLKRLTQRGELPCYRVGNSRVLRLKTADVARLLVRVA